MLLLFFFFFLYFHIKINEDELLFIITTADDLPPFQGESEAVSCYNFLNNSRIRRIERINFVTVR